MSWEEYEKLEDRNKDEEDCGEPMVGKEEVEEQEVGEEDTAERRAERRAERKAERKAEKKAAKKAERQAEKGVKRRRSYVDVAEWCKNLTE
jgi:DnaJ family protein A protein 5